MPALHNPNPDPLVVEPYIMPLATIAGERFECLFCLGMAITQRGTCIFRVCWGE